MAIEHILKRIEEEAAAAVKERVAAAEREAERIGAEFAAGGERLAAELRARAGKRAAEEERRIVVGEQLELRKALLAKKREILEEIYAEAKSRLAELDGDDYLATVGGIIVERAVTGREEIVSAAAKRDLFTPAFLSSLNEAWPGGGDFRLAGDSGDFAWGVVLREGKRIVDLSLDVFFEQVRERVEPGIGAILFREE
ncbi:MAG: V-type ATP synthase subunit E [Candidatus Krumholzibacteriota bacterium]|nr:V-type ATP synthase subunit E [Candidatus Krumholzibacteriota bacterium]